MAKEGNGIYQYCDGRRYEGNFKNDLPNGYGSFYYPDGTIFQGFWKDGLEHGEGFEI